MSSKYEEEDFRTPNEFFLGVQEFLGKFDLDAAASSDNTKCTRYFTKDTNGLLRDWFGNVWCNPPYSDPKVWLEKAIRELDENRCDKVTFLLHLDSSTKWFHNCVLERAAEIYFVKGRLNFTGPYSLNKGVSPRSSVLIVFTKKAFKSHTRIFCGIDKKGRIIRNQMSLCEFF